MKTLRVGPRESVVEFLAAALKSRGYYRTQWNLQVALIRKIGFGKTLFVDYKTKYWLKQSRV